MKIIIHNLFRMLALIWIACGGISVLMAADLNARFAVSGGKSFLPDGNLRDRDSAPYTVSFKNGFQFGFLAAVDLHPPISLEAGFRNEWGRFHLRGGNPPLETETVGFTSQQFFCDAVYYTPYSSGGLRLFATGGIGLRRIQPESGSGSDSGWNVNYGGGLEGRAGRRYSVRAEVRDFVGDMPPLLNPQPCGGLLHDVQLSLGLVVHLK